MSERADERRKFHRVQIQNLGASITGLTVQLVGVGPVELVDIGYGGAAFSQPQKARVSLTGETVHLDFLINGQSSQSLSGKVVRLTNEMFAIEFIDASKKTKVFVDKLISNRMVGLNMNLIDPQFYRGKETFAYWFHGPKSTNLFLWEEQGQLKKASLDFTDVALHWENGLFQIDNKMNRGQSLQGAALGEGVFRLAAEVLSQMRSNVDILEEFKTAVFEKAIPK
jgi:hypothetical protein